MTYQAWRKVHGRTQMSGAGFTVPAAGGGTFDIGLNFRATSGFVTDGANQTYVLAADAYPTTRGGVTFGYEDATGIDARDRSAGVDVRLAGMHFKVNDATSTATFRLDLPSSGSCTVRLAVGDQGNGQTHYMLIQDGTTSFITYSADNSAPDKTLDATKVELTTSAWPGSNTSVARTFGNAVCRIVLGGTVGSNATAIQHIQITKP